MTQPISGSMTRSSGCILPDSSKGLLSEHMGTCRAPTIFADLASISFAVSPPRYSPIASITTTHLAWDARRWTMPFVNVYGATVPAVFALRSFPEAVRQPVVPSL